MEISHNDESHYEKLKPVLQSKVEEFLLLGYDAVTERDIWGYFVNKKWKKDKSDLKLFEVVQEILTLKIGDFMNYKTVETLKEASFSLENDEDRLELLK